MASVRAATAQDAVTCAAIVTDLPDHFTDDVADKVRSDLLDHGGWVVDDGGDVVGFVIAERRGTRAAEIVWAASRRRSPRSGPRHPPRRPCLGRAERRSGADRRGQDARSVRRLSPYEATRAFWLARGFIQFDTIDPLPDWPPGNPAAILAVAPAPTR